jgi:hypothetical protein
MRFSVPHHFQSLKALKNVGASLRRRNSGLIRVSLNHDWTFSVRKLVLADVQPKFSARFTA